MCIKPLFFYDLSPIFFNRGIECSSLSTLNINLCITFWCYILSGSIGGILGLVQSVQMILKVSFVFYYVDLSLVIIFLKKKKNLLHHYILWYNWATYVIWGISEPNWCCVEFQFHVKLYWFGFFFVYCRYPILIS